MLTKMEWEATAVAHQLDSFLAVANGLSVTQNKVHILEAHNA